MVTADEYARWAADLPAGDDRAEREREFAAVYATHDRLLAQQGALDFGDLVLHAHALLRDKPHVRARVAARHRHLLVDDVQDLEHAAIRLVLLLSGDGPTLTAAGDDDQAIRRLRGAAAKNLRDLAAEVPGVRTVRLEASLRCPERIVAAAGAVVRPIDERIDKRLRRAGGRRGAVLARGERARPGAGRRGRGRAAHPRAAPPPSEIAILVRSVRNEGQAVALALEERAVPHRLAGATAFFQRAEVKDVLAWLRLLVDPSDAGAGRARARAAAGRAALDRPRPLRADRAAAQARHGRRARRRDRVAAAPARGARADPGFLKLHRSAAAALDTTRPDVFVHRLIDRLGLRRQQLFAAQADVVERLVDARAARRARRRYVRRAPQATPREFARSIAAVAEAGLRDEEGGVERRARRGAPSWRCRRPAGWSSTTSSCSGCSRRGCRARGGGRWSRSRTRCCTRSCRPTRAPRTSTRCAGCCTSR